MRFPYQFEGESRPISKLFVVVAHVNGYAICIKATHLTIQYEDNKSLMVGCVYYAAGQVSCFPENTAIQPDNQFPISHSQIEDCYARGEVHIHQLPSDFQSRLQQAAKNSETLSGRKRKRIQELIG